MKLLIPLIVALSALSAFGQRTYTHTVRTGDRVVTYRTRCTGRYSTNCTTTVTEGTGSPYRAPVPADLESHQAACRGLRSAYGKNLQRYPMPLDDYSAVCLKSVKTALQIMRSNESKRARGEDPRTVNPLATVPVEPPPPMPATPFKTGPPPRAPGQPSDK